MSELCLVRCIAGVFARAMNGSPKILRTFFSAGDKRLQGSPCAPAIKGRPAARTRKTFVKRFTGSPVNVFLADYFTRYVPLTTQTVPLTLVEYPTLSSTCP